MVELSLVSLNVERSKHVDLVAPFLERQRSDVVCLQELMETDIARFESSLGARCTFSAMAWHPTSGGACIGMGIFTHPAATSHIEEKYAGPDTLVDLDETDAATQHATSRRAVLFVEVEKNDVRFKIGTTHFTWTPKGLPDEFQREDLHNVLGILERSGEFVLTADCNAPRGGEIFGALAARYKDNVPPECLTSIDIDLHRFGKIRPEEFADKMVDGIFSTPQYFVSDVKLVSGVSDHMAILAKVGRV